MGSPKKALISPAAHCSGPSLSALEFKNIANNSSHFLDCIIISVPIYTHTSKMEHVQQNRTYKVKKHNFKGLLTCNTLLCIYKTEASMHKQKDLHSEIWTTFNHSMQLKHYMLGKKGVDGCKSHQAPTMAISSVNIWFSCKNTHSAVLKKQNTLNPIYLRSTRYSMIPGTIQDLLNETVSHCKGEMKLLTIFPTSYRRARRSHTTNAVQRYRQVCFHILFFTI